MSLPNFVTALKPPTSGYGTTGTSCPNETNNSRRQHHQPPFFLSLDSAEVPTPHKRRIVPLPSPPASPDTPLTSSDSETFSPESPMIRCLDPAHRPSPRSIHALRSQHPPLTVINNDRNGSSSRLFPTTTAVGRSWSGRWSSSSAENFAAMYHDHSGVRDVQQPLWPPRYAAWTSRVPLEVRHGEHWYSGHPLRLTFLIIAVVLLALCLTLVPAIMISRQMVEMKNPDEFFGAFKERPVVTVATWYAIFRRLILAELNLVLSVRINVKRSSSFH